MTQVLEETEIKGGVWMSPEDYAALMERDPSKRSALLRKVKDMLRPKGDRCRTMFDPKHVKRLNRQMVRLYVTRPTATAEAAPRIIPRAK